MSSRINTPAPPHHATAAGLQGKPTVEDILSQLEPLDTEAVLAEWEQRLLAEDEVEDLPGLIPVYKPKLEVNETVVSELNEGELEFIGGVKDHTGQFKEWHEMISLERGCKSQPPPPPVSGSDAGQDHEPVADLLYILPYSVID